MKPVNISSLNAREFQAGLQSSQFSIDGTENVEEAAEHVWPLGKIFKDKQF